MSIIGISNKHSDLQTIGDELPNLRIILRLVQTTVVLTGNPPNGWRQYVGTVQKRKGGTRPQKGCGSTTNSPNYAISPSKVTCVEIERCAGVVRILSQYEGLSRTNGLGTP